MAIRNGVIGTWSPAQMSLIIGGANKGFKLSGWKSMSVKRNTPNSKFDVSADGQNVRTITADQSHTISITFIQTSDGEELLAGMYAADILANRVKTPLGRLPANATSIPFGAFPLTMKDTGSGDSYECTEAYIETEPDREWGAELSDRTWTIFAPYIALKKIAAVVVEGAQV